MSDQLPDSACPAPGQPGARGASDKAADEELPAQWLHELVDRAPVLIFGKDLQGRYLFVNEQYARTFGIPVSAIRGRTDAEIFGPELAEKFREADRMVAQCREPRVFEEYAPHPDGLHTYSSLKFPLYDDDGELSAICGIAADVTVRRQLESYRTLLVEAGVRLVGSLDLWTTLETIADLALKHLSRAVTLDLADEHGKIVREIVRSPLPWPESTVRRLKDYASSLPAAHPTRRVLSGEPALALQEVTPEMLDAFSVDEGHRQLLEELRIRSMAAIPLIARGRLLGSLSLTWDEPGRPTAEVMAVASALADRAALAIDNAQLSADWKEVARLREEVIGVISHDLRNPLQAILLSVSRLLESDEEPSSSVVKGLSRIRSAAERANRLIHALLDFARARAGSLRLDRRPSDLHTLVRGICDEHQLSWPDRTIALEQHGSGEGEWDETRLAQVVANLVANALQYSPADSVVRVRSEGRDGEVRLTVHNEGPPVEEALLPVLFDPFRRGAGGARAGLGLGLYIAQQVVQAHGGRISVESSAGRGTTFTVLLPRQGEPG